jgi:uroporphyrinogen decarboxylase
MSFQPDYNNILDAALNRRPKRLPLYEHIISPVIMGKIMDNDFAMLETNSASDLKEFFRYYCEFFKEMTYDTVSYEVTIVDVMPAAGQAILGKVPGPIQSRKDFDSTNWQALVDKYIKHADKRFTVLGNALPEGMKAIGGIGNGVFEISEELVGLEHLAYMQVDDPELFSDIYKKIGEIMLDIWHWFLKKHGSNYVVCRFGDDLGYKSGTLTSPAVIKKHILPQYKPIINLIRQSGYPFLWHSCGCIFEIMDDVIELGINAKHSNEDSISPFDKWIELYSDRIGLFGGIDVDLLCQRNPAEIEQIVYEDGRRYRANAHGFALGSGNSIPDYVPVDGYLAMVEAIKKIREDELKLPKNT